MTTTSFRVLSILSMLLAACGGATRPAPAAAVVGPPPPPTPVNARGDEEVVATIGPAGGSLELAAGWRIEIPEGALDAEVEVRFARGADAHVFDHEEGETEVGSVAELSPMVIPREGHLFRISAPTARVPAGFDEAEVVLGMEEETRGRAFADATATRWQYHRGSVEGGRYVANVAYLGGHRLQFGLLRDE